MFRLGLAALLAVSLALPGGGAWAQAADAAPLGVAVTGRVAHPGTLTLAELQALPPVTVDVPQAAAGPHRYVGALLWTVVDGAAPLDDSPRTRLQHTLLARGRDGYAAALAMGELAPDFENKPVIVAYAEDGAPLPVLRLIVPGDARAGRSVRDLVGVEVR